MRSEYSISVLLPIVKTEASNSLHERARAAHRGIDADAEANDESEISVNAKPDIDVLAYHLVSKEALKRRATPGGRRGGSHQLDAAVIQRFESTFEPVWKLL